MRASVRLYFKQFNTNYYFSEQRSHIMKGIKLKQQLKNKINSQLFRKYAPLPLSKCPLKIDFTFITTRPYPISNYCVLVDYILDCLVKQQILQDKNLKIITSININVQETTSPSQEGCIFSFTSFSDLSDLARRCV